MPVLSDLAHLIFALIKLVQAYRHLQPSNETLVLIGVVALVGIGGVVWWELARAKSEPRDTEASVPAEPGRVPNCGKQLGA